MMKNVLITPSKLLLFVLVALMGYLQYNEKKWQQQPGVIYWDAISYYAYLPATFIYDDIKLEKAESYEKGLFWPEHTAEGKAVIKTTMGLAYLYAPFFGLAHAFAKVSGAPATGFSAPYQIALLIGALFYLFWGLFFLRKVLLKFFNELTSTITLVTVVMGTNLAWYVSFEAVMSHGYIFSIGCVFLWTVVIWHEKPNLRNTFWVGLLAGLLTLIRPTNILVLLFWGFYAVNSIADFQNKLRLIFGKPTILITLALSFLLPWIMQMIYWKVTSGHFFFYSYTANETFLLNNPKIGQILFGFRKGWFIYTPVMLLAIAGLFRLKKERKQFLFATLSLLIPFVYLVSCWWCWWFGGSFGLRPMIDIYAFMTIPLAAFVSFFTEKAGWAKWAGVGLISLFVFHNCFQLRQYYNGAIHYAFMTGKAYCSSFGHLTPQPGFYDLLQEPDPEPAKLDIQSLLIHMQDQPLTPDSGKIAFNYTDIAEPGDATKNIELYTEAESFSPTHSLKAELHKPFCFDIRIPVTNLRAQLLVRVKKLGGTGRLVIQAEKPSEFCVSSGEGRAIDGSNWQQQEFLLEIPKLNQSKYIRVFCCNPVNYLQYYDDFELYILN